MEAQIRIPTIQFGYIEVTFEGSEEEIVAKHNELVRLYSGEAGPGLSPTDFNNFIDKYLETGTGTADVYAQMDVEQQKQVQCIKRAFARIKSKEKK